jgi:hypothetical protein
VSVPLWGVLAEFDTVPAVLAAAEQVRDAGFKRFDVHSPIPIHGLDEAMGIKQSWIPRAVLVGGIAGAAVGLGIQIFMNAVDYKFLISGKPLFAWPAGIPVIFELTILLAALGAVGGLFVAAGWPELYHPLFKVDRFRTATADRFFVSIQADDPAFDAALTRQLLENAGARWVGDVEA